MIDLKEKYIINKQQEPVAVQLDIKTFRKIEETLEDYALAQYMDETETDQKFSLKEARKYYKGLLKNQ